jgi:hypothetical protein
VPEVTYNNSSPFDAVEVQPAGTFHWHVVPDAGVWSSL